MKTSKSAAMRTIEEVATTGVMVKGKGLPAVAVSSTLRSGWAVTLK
jgi:hypothetical protein